MFVLSLIAVTGIVAALLYQEQTRPASTKITKQPSIVPIVEKKPDSSQVLGNLVPPLEPYMVSQAASTTKPKKIVDKVATITAEAYLVGNLTTGEIYAKKGIEQAFAIASISKLFTADVLADYVASGTVSASTSIEITQPMLDVYGEQGELKLGDIYTVDELIYPMLLESSNDAAEALATTTGYEAFIKAMNSKASGLGLTHTNFADANGLSEKNISSAHDLFRFAQYLFNKGSDTLRITSSSSYDIASTTEHSAHHFVNINPFVGDPHFIGGKTGRTVAAKESMLSLFNYKMDGLIYPIAIITLRSDYGSRQFDSAMLFEEFLAKTSGAH
jgi:D-alanyl-D-alanine carboxypeptidase